MSLWGFQGHNRSERSDRRSASLSLKVGGVVFRYISRTDKSILLPMGLSILVVQLLEPVKPVCRSLDVFPCGNEGFSVTGIASYGLVRKGQCAAWRCMMWIDTIRVYLVSVRVNCIESRCVGNVR